MSRSGYSDDYDGDQWAMIRWRGAVASAMHGKRGQSFLREMIAAMDAMPNKRLITNKLMRGGDVCALGAVSAARRKDVRNIDPENSEAVSAEFGIADAMAREIVYMNDECGLWGETPEQRFHRMRKWAEGWLRKDGEQ